MAVAFEIVLRHEGPVSIDALQQSIAVVTRAAGEAMTRLLDAPEFLPEKWSSERREEARRLILEASRHAFWLEYVEPGSSKFSGKVGTAILTVLSAVTGKVASDIVMETQAYKEFKQEAVAVIDRKFAELFREEINSYMGGEPGPDRISFELQVEGDRMRLWVIPGKRHTDITTVI